MSNYLRKFNPWTKTLQWVVDANLLKIKGTIDTKNDLPLTGNLENDCYIVKDTDRLYTWGISASSGTIDDWKDVGSTTEIDWDAISNKPTSSVADIDDAVSKKHSQNTDTKLDEGGANEVSVVDIDDAVSKKHSQNTDTSLDGVTGETIKTSSLEFVIDGGGEVISLGIAGDLEVPFNCEILQVSLLGDQTGSIKIDIWKNTYANFPPTDANTITGSNEPEISASVKDQDSTLTSWTKSISAGDILRFNVDTVTTIKKCLISLKIRKV